MSPISGLFLALTAALCAGSSCHAEAATATTAGDGLLDATSVLAQTAAKRSPSTAVAESPAAVLLQDIVGFRQEGKTLSADDAAQGWLALFDRAQALKAGPRSASLLSYDFVTGAQVGMRSVIAALPPPPTWPALHRLTSERAAARAGDSEALTLKLLGELLSRDRAAANASIDQLQTLARDKDKESREALEEQLIELQQQLIELYGSDKEIATLFEHRVDSAKRNIYWSEVETPDLVGILGVQAAEKLLSTALRQPVMLTIEHGSATHTLAKQLVIRNMASLARAQWQLVDGKDTIAFYEAMRERFGSKAADGDTSSISSMLDPGRVSANQYYLLALIIAKRHDDAEQVLRQLAESESYYSWTSSVEALREAGESDALVVFLDAQLRAHPELDVWSLYLEEAAYVSRHAESLALLDELLARGDLPTHLKTTLRRSRIDAQLASDQTAPALKALSDSLAKPPTAKEEGLDERFADAIKLAALARVLQQPKLAVGAFSFAERALAVMLPRADEHSSLATQLKALYAELRRQNQPGRAQLVALGVLNRPLDPAIAAYTAFRPDPLKRAALIELVGIYDSANRPADALQLIDASADWSARSLREIVSETDSLGTPIGTLTARSLAALGMHDAALGSTELVLQNLPGHDGGYALLLQLLPDTAAARLDAIYGGDAFEERPLIWKAIALKQQGKQVASEASVRAAIAIDPSDGEQGRGDRMRAYAVLADLLELKGETDTAAVYRGAVAAIRLSEAADELHALGLYRRAFDSYGKALEQFSDAYCIQSRLAVQLTKQGLGDQALQHYRRAYELMPDSFGRVESHCFGCESVFQDSAAQSVAEQVFNDILKSSPNKPQAHYMLAYLRIEQGRPNEALDPLRQAVALDGDYLNAWKKLNELGESTYIPAAERDIARLKLIELDPAKRHVRYETNQVGDLAALWRAVEVAQIRRGKMALTSATPYPFAASAGAIKSAIEELPDANREQSRQYYVVSDAAVDAAVNGDTPAQALSKHVLLQSVSSLLGEASHGYE